MASQDPAFIPNAGELPAVPLQFVASPRHTEALDRLTAQARADLERINVPPPAWVLPAESSTAESPVLDVLVAGAGMCGQTAAYALRREGVTNIRVIDRAARGEEGPWSTYARMLTLRSPKHVGGRRERVRARQLVLALGRDGSGAPRWPDFPSLRPGDPLAAGRVFHSADAIDFASWEGCRIGVLGAGASAFDNAACALEAGASNVTLFARRAHLPQVNKSKAASTHGFLRGFEGLDDPRKWRVYTYIFDEQVPPPWETVRRCDAHDAFELRLGTPWVDVATDEDGVTVTLPNGGMERFDAVIFGTGFDVDLIDRPEIAAYTTQIDTWARHVSASEAERHPEPARFPYLGAGFELRSADPAHPQASALARMRLFNWGATMSHGALAGDIPGLAIGATRLAQGIACDLFVEDADRHWDRLRAHDEPELIATRWYVPPSTDE